MAMATGEYAAMINIPLDNVNQQEEQDGNGPDVINHNHVDVEQPDINYAVNNNNGEDDNNCPPAEHNTEQVDLKEELVYSPYHQVRRFSRTLHRSEVLGFGFVSVVIMSIVLQALLGLEAVGIFSPVGGQVQQFPSTHASHSFSWRILSDFFIPDYVTPSEKQCLYLNKYRKTDFFVGRSKSGGKGSDLAEGLYDVESENVLTKLMEASWAKFINTYDSENMDDPIASTNGNRTHQLRCGRSTTSDGWTWLCKYMMSICMPIVNLCCSIVLLSSIRCRRKRGLQFTLMLPAFIAVFLGIFQQIPMIFTYSYIGVSLSEEMNEASTKGVPPVFLAPIWDETQYHGKCCGIQSPDTWMVRKRGGDLNFNIYPPSCCNTDIHKCRNKYAKRYEIWDKGCFKQEYDQIRFYQFCAMVILIFKLFAEMGILWCLSDLTRYEYPRVENQHNATCDVRDFEVRTKGVATIAGVTLQQKMVIKINHFHPRKYEYRTQHSGTCKIIDIRKLDGHAGSVEIRRLRRNRSTENASIDMDRGRLQGLIFLSF